MLQRLCVLVLLVGASVVSGSDVDAFENQISPDSRQIQSGEELVSEIVSHCFTGDVGYMNCVRSKVLNYLDTITPKGRSMSEVKDMDKEIMMRIARYLKTHEFKVQLPEFLFQRAQITIRPARGLANFKVDFPAEDKNEDRSFAQARGVLKKKLLLPVLLLLKLKLKALTPILLALVGIKSLKALILSKIAILVVVGFVVSQLLKKGGMPMPMPMMPEPAMPMPYGPPAPSPAPAAPAMGYGAPATAPAMGYGAPATAPAPSSPPSSYEPGWEPSNGGSTGSGGPYSRVWDSHQMAYSAYYNPQPASQTIPTKSSSSSTY